MTTLNNTELLIIGSINAMLQRNKDSDSEYKGVLKEVHCV